MKATVGCALCCILASVSFSLPTYHQPQLSVFVSTLPNVSSTDNASGLAAVELGEASAFLDVSPGSISSANLVAVPVGIVPICIAYSLLNVSATPAASLEVWAQMLRGVSNGLFLADSTKRVPILNASAVDFVIANNSGANSVLLAALASSGASEFNDTQGTQYPLSVLANPRVRFVADEAAVAAELAKGGNTVGFLPLPVAISSGLPCARITEFDDSTYLDTYLSPRLTASQSELFAVDFTKLVATRVTSLVYPLAGLLVVIVGRSNACAGNQDATTLAREFLLSDVFHAAVLQWSILPLPATNALLGVSLLADKLCLPEMRVRSGGSSAIHPVICDLSMWYFPKTNRFIEYKSTGSGTGIANTKSNAFLIAGSDISNSISEMALYPALRYLPAVSFGVSLAYSFPDTVQLLIPRCAVVPIFNGSIVYWDDTILQSANRGIRLPHEKIQIIARRAKSGTTEVFTTGLDQIDRSCNRGRSTVTPTSVYNMVFDRVQRYDTNEAITAALRNTPYSIGYVTVSHARSSNLAEAKILDPDTGTQISAETAAIQSTLSTASIDSQTLAVSMGVTPGGWPLTGVSYLIFNSERTGNCTEFAQGLKFIETVLLDPEARTRMIVDNYVPVPTSLATLSSGFLYEAKCDGSYVYPRASSKSDNTLAIVIGVVVGVFAVFVAGGLALFCFTHRGRRDTSAAPKDASAPFAVAFTDIQASTALWAQIPELMAPALDAHHELIRALITKHNAYEVKTIGDAFMVVSTSLENVTMLALDIQDEFKNFPWGTDLIDDVYVQLEMQLREESANVPAPVAEDLYKTIWGGLRVRVGVHYGFGDIRLDDVSKGYDYYGGVVNTAARVESIAHGGQVLMSSTAFDALYQTETGTKLATTITVIDLGPQILKGLEDPVSIQQISRGVFSARRFPPLRLEKAAEVTDTTEDNQNSTLGDVTATSSSMTGSMIRQRRDVTSETMSVMLSTLSKSERKKVLTSLCSGWRIPFDGSTKNANAATMFLSKRVGPIVAEKMRATGFKSGGSGFGGSIMSRNLSMKGSMKGSATFASIGAFDPHNDGGSVSRTLSMKENMSMTPEATMHSPISSVLLSPRF